MVRWLTDQPRTFGPVWFSFLGWAWDGSQWRTETHGMQKLQESNMLLVLNNFYDKYGEVPGSIKQGDDGVYRTGRVWFYDESDPGATTWREYTSPGMGEPTKAANLPLPYVDPGALPAPPAAKPSTSGSGDSGGVVLAFIASVVIVGILLLGGSRES
jgi:hypothetical protein